MNNEHGYLMQFDSVRAQMDPCITQLADELDKGLNNAQVSVLEQFVKDVSAVRSRYSSLKPTFRLRRIHKKFEPVLSSHEKMAQHITSFLTEKSWESFDVMCDALMAELSELQRAILAFAEERNRLMGKRNDFYQKLNRR